MNRPLLKFVMAVMLPSLPLSALACGYHDPDQIRVGPLNWFYENSLHVRDPIFDAQKDGRLPPTDYSRLWVLGPYREVLDAQAFEKTKQALEALDAVFQALETDQAQKGFSMVLVETALWTRFPASGSETELAVDAGAAGEDDLVVVTGEPVVEGLLQRRLTISEALDSGYVRLYGTPKQISEFRATYGKVGGQKDRGDRGIEEKRSS